MEQPDNEYEKQQKAFHDLLAKINAGDQEAARTFVDRFGNALLRVIRRRLDPKMRRQFDSIDFLQDVMASFLCKPPEPDAFANADALYIFLTRLARNKVITAQRQRGRQKCNIYREHSLDGSARYQAHGVRGDDPTPSQVVGAEEQWAGMLNKQIPRHQNILGMLREGMSYREIAEALNINVKQVQRVVERLRSKASS
jgi:RNA polymerase sigma factor (sigma-70 family)